MSGIKGGSTTESETTKNSKSKKRCESSMTEVNPSHRTVLLKKHKVTQYQSPSSPDVFPVHTCLRRPRVDRENVGRRGGSILSNFLFIQKDRSLFWVGIFTQPVNLVPGIGHTVRYTNTGNQTGEPAWLTVVFLILFDPLQQAPCWVNPPGLLRI